MGGSIGEASLAGRGVRTTAGGAAVIPDARRIAEREGEVDRNAPPLPSPLAREGNFDGTPSLDWGWAWPNRLMTGETP